MRNFTLDNVNGTTTELYGIELLEFTLRSTGFANATTNPENAAYYSFGPNGMVRSFSSLTPYIICLLMMYMNR
jgi:hypothetical protein